MMFRRLLERIDRAADEGHRSERVAARWHRKHTRAYRWIVGLHFGLIACHAALIGLYLVAAEFHRAATRRHERAAEGQEGGA